MQLAAGVSGIVFCAIDAGLGAAGVKDALVASGGLPDYSRLFTAQLWADARWLRSSDGYERKAR